MEKLTEEQVKAIEEDPKASRLLKTLNGGITYGRQVKAYLPDSELDEPGLFKTYFDARDLRELADDARHLADILEAAAPPSPTQGEQGS